MPTLGPYPAIRDGFAELMRAWIRGPCPPIKRFAFTGLMIQEAGSHNDAYCLLQQYLPKVQIDPESTDFNYRINRRVRSATAAFDLPINRLATWSAAKFSVSARAFLPGGETEGVPVQVSPTQYAAIVQFDVNTDAERLEELPHDDLERLLNELIEFATAIASRGDVP